MIAADRAVELAVEVKIGPSGNGPIEDAVLEWLQRWGWDAKTGRLHPNGIANQVSVTVMSFCHEARRRVGSAVPWSQLLGSAETALAPASNSRTRHCAK